VNFGEMIIYYFVGILRNASEKIHFIEHRHSKKQQFLKQRQFMVKLCERVKIRIYHRWLYSNSVFTSLILLNTSFIKLYYRLVKGK
jgi:hypothetical protein